ncbi:MAG: LacI family DNA-binding transcriptional regulator [Armatimonadaceae bacterium]
MGKRFPETAFFLEVVRKQDKERQAMPSIKEVAAVAKVSQATVSKVLNNRSDTQISLATRQRVREAADRLGYHPSAVARGLAGKRMNAINIVMAYAETSVTSDPYLGPCLDGILAVCKREQQKAVLFLEDDWQSAFDRFPAFCDGTSDGVLLMIPRTDSQVVEVLASRSVPFVLVGDSREDARMNCVDVDNMSGTRKAIEHLLALGHRRIAAFAGNEDFCSNGQRMTAYRKALRDAGLPVDPALIFPGEYHPEYGERNVRILLERFAAKDRPTAIFCFCDAIAVGALSELAKAGVDVPGEISVVGFDDIPRAATLSPPLTTVRQSVRQVGECAVELLLSRIGGDVPPGKRILLNPEMVLRGSTAPPCVVKF